MPPKTISTDAEQAKDVLLWARKQRIAVAKVRVGDCELEVIDLGIPSDDKPVRLEPKKSIYEDMAGDLLDHPQPTTNEPTEQDDD